MSTSIFTRIINGEIPCFKIAENHFSIAFLDISPLKKGHTLIVPKLQINELFKLPKKNYCELMNFTYDIAKAIQKTILCKRIGVVVIGTEIPHAHVHLVPINEENDLNFKNSKLQLLKEEMEDIAKQISKNL